MRKLPIDRMPRLRKRTERARAARAGGGLAALLAGALVLALAAPALAGSVYRWQTPEGGVAYTDDPERIPPRHRERAERVELAGLEGYARYTPKRAEEGEGYPERLAQRLERLRALNASVREREAAGAPYGMGREAVLQMDSGMKLRVPTEASEGSHEPLVIEKVRVREPGTTATKTDTVVRRGEDVYVVVSPLGELRSRPGAVPSEARLLRPEDEE